ncbi:MAG: M28 family peptidase [Phycisphaerales bacterium]|nr:M28 family peptidase [Phycisphaerales bacterium]
MIHPRPNFFRSSRVSRCIAALGAVIVVGGTQGAFFNEPPESASLEPTKDLLTSVVESPTASRLRAWHDLLGSEPHVAGGAGDAVVIAAIAGAFQGMGLETEVWRFSPLLCRPVSASLTIVEGTGASGAASTSKSGDQGRRRRGIMSLSLQEKELLADPATRHPELDRGWNAYSGSGEVEAGVVYANRGRREDFARLRELGVDCTGQIVLVRYGGNYRGFKVRFAEEAGAAGLVIFTDPGDSGDDRGPTWPDGGWANDTCIQRGSIVTLPYKGDPLTPFEPSIPGTERLAIEEVGLPEIPVQPIGYAAATRIMAAMNGSLVEDAAWKGGLDVPYRLDGGDLELRLEVQQTRSIMETANVFGSIRGSESPDDVVIVGCHHDAWGFGAADPLAGTIVLMETATAFASALEQGFRPRRTVIFAAWGAEEFGIIGSSEWCEDQRDRLGANGVAYINLDMAAMGTTFRASASPSLQSAVIRAAGLVEQPGNDTGTVRDAWAGDRETPRLGDLGGGSDHVGFLCHLCIPSISLGAGGSAGTSYHSNYDTLAWYRSTVGEDYDGALMVTRLCAALTADLADAPVLPIEPSAIARDLPARLEKVARAADAAGLTIDLSPLLDELTALNQALLAAQKAVESVTDDRRRLKVNASLRLLERAWGEDSGLPGRPWFRNVFATSNRDSGYGAVVLPLFMEAIVDRDQAALDQAFLRYQDAFRRLAASAKDISDSLDSSSEDS